MHFTQVKPVEPVVKRTWNHKSVTDMEYNFLSQFQLQGRN